MTGPTLSGYGLQARPNELLKRRPLQSIPPLHFLVVTLVLSVSLAGCASPPEQDPHLKLTLLNAPEEVVLGEEIHINWSIEGATPGDPYRTGVHYGNASTEPVPDHAIGLEHLPHSTAHSMGDGGGEFSADFHPLTTGMLYLRLHVERHNSFIWGTEFTINVAEPDTPIILLDANRIPEATWANHRTQIGVVLAPTPVQKTNVDVVASYAGENITIGTQELEGPGPHAVQVMFPKPGQSVSIHAEARSDDGHTMVSPARQIHVVHERGLLGYMVGGDLAAPTGQPFSVYWRIAGEPTEVLDHNEVHWAMYSEILATKDPESLQSNATAKWDEMNQAFRVTLTEEKTGFLLVRIHTKVGEVETWSRIYGIEIYPS